MPNIKKLALGTAAFGMDYGVTNDSGQVGLDQALEIIRLALEKNAELIIDTAADYGESEAVLGKVLGTLGAEAKDVKIISKTSTNATSVKDSFENSLEVLGLSTLYALLDHNATHLKSSNGAQAFRDMEALKTSGVVQKIGASVYNAEDIDYILERYDIDLVQIPLNILDQRLITSGHLKKLKDRGVKVHVRSVFLQGLLLTPIDHLPGFMSTHKEYFEAFQNACTTHEILPSQASLSFVNNLDEIDALVIGVTNTDELKQHLEGASKALPPHICAALSCETEFVVNPALWPPRS